MAQKFEVERLYAARNPSELTTEYDRIAESYDAALIDEHEWRMPEIMAGLAAWLLPRSARILDAACGTGLVGEHLKRFGFVDLHGVDLSPGMLAVAARKNVYQSLRMAALGTVLPYQSGEFDAFTVAGAFTPQHAPPESLQELLRVTRPGGYAIFSLRSDAPPPGFAEEIERLSAAGRWTRLKEGAEFQSLPLAEPHVRNRLYVYEIAARSAR
ncbi:MAG: class I SAM-dependent DNA methyltransferase [Steroidobacterales bacterium]